MILKAMIHASAKDGPKDILHHDLLLLNSRCLRIANRQNLCGFIGPCIDAVNFLSPFSGTGKYPVGVLKPEINTDTTLKALNSATEVMRTVLGFFNINRLGHDEIGKPLRIADSMKPCLRMPKPEVPEPEQDIATTKPGNAKTENPRYDQ